MMDDPPPHTTPPPPEPIVIDDDGDTDIKPAQPAEAEQSPPPPAPAPAPTAPATAAKPKSTKTPKPARSPSPTPPPPPPPLQTIRLDITLGGPDNYMVDIYALAKETGQRPPTPEVVRHSDSEDDEPEDVPQPPPNGETSDVENTAKKKKRRHANEYYDTRDPFIDDSELAIDERTYFAQTKQKGFYVSAGEVALVRDKSPKKPPRSRAKPPASTAAVTGDEPKAEAMDVDNPEDAEKVGQKRKRYVTIVENGKKRKVVDETSFHPDLQKSIESLKEAIAKEDWSQKGKFPVNIRPILAKVALLAVRLHEYDEHFFDLMPRLFPYNKFTMSKLIKRTIYHEHVKILQERIDSSLAELENQAKDGFANAEKEWRKAVLAWDIRQEKARLEANTPPPPPPTDGQHQTSSESPTRHPTEEDDKDAMDVDAPAEKAPEGKDGKESGAHPPAKKYRMTESMKALVWKLVLLSNEKCRLENEKNTLEGSINQVSEQSLRKVLYQRIVAAFPEGWMSSGQISRDVSAMKKKLEREALEAEAQ